MASDWQLDRDMESTRFAWAISFLGMSQAAAGRYLGISERQVARMVHGEAKVPTAIVLLLNALIEFSVRPVVPKRRRPLTDTPDTVSVP